MCFNAVGVGASLQPIYNNRAENGRGKGIRTPDILLPKQARYRTALYPDKTRMHLVRRILSG